jgi:hypothetical protein
MTFLNPLTFPLLPGNKYFQKINHQNQFTMRRKLIPLAVFILSMTLIACGGKKQTAASIAREWCDLNAKAYKAAEGPAKDAAEEARKKFEKEMEEKYKADDAFMKEIGKEVEKCEAASEGR